MCLHSQLHKFTKVSIFEKCNNLDLLVLEVNKPNSKPFLVYCWYRLAHSPVEYFDVFEELVNNTESYHIRTFT